MEGGESTDVVELKENGANIPVTKDNRSVLFLYFLILLSCYKCMK